MGWGASVRFQSSLAVGQNWTLPRIDLRWWCQGLSWQPSTGSAEPPVGLAEPPKGGRSRPPTWSAEPDNQVNGASADPESAATQTVGEPHRLNHLTHTGNATRKINRRNAPRTHTQASGPVPPPRAACHESARVREPAAGVRRTHVVTSASSVSPTWCQLACTVPAGNRAPMRWWSQHSPQPGMHTGYAHVPVAVGPVMARAVRQGRRAWWRRSGAARPHHRGPWRRCLPGHGGGGKSLSHTEVAKECGCPAEFGPQVGRHLHGLQPAAAHSRAREPGRRSGPARAPLRLGPWAPYIARGDN